MRIAKIVVLVLVAAGISLAARQLLQIRSPISSSPPVEHRDFSLRLKITSSIPRRKSGVYHIGDVALLNNGEAWAVGYDNKHLQRVYHSNQNGRTWEPVSIPGDEFILKAISFTDSQHGWAVGGNGLVICTTNGGKSWQLLKSPTTTDLEAVYFVTSRIGYTGGRYGSRNIITDEVRGSVEILCTKDAGETWRRCYEDNEPSSVFQIASTSEVTAFAVVGGNRLLRTDNQGKSWKNIPLSVKYVTSIAFAPDGTGWLVGSHGTFQTSSDGGRTWQQPALLPQDFADRDWWEVAFNSDGTGLAVGDNSTIALTTDNGKTWKLQNLQISDHLRAVRVQGPHAIVLGSERAYLMKITN